MLFKIHIGLLIILTTNFDIANSKPDALTDRCGQPYLKNGFARMKQRRKMVKFDCQRGFQLIGTRYAGCINGKWDSPMPVCAKSGCGKIKIPANGFITGEIGGLKVELFCKESYQTAGNRIAYCDGENWSHELGSCRETSKTAQLWCDFETEDLCGWTHYDNYDFEWRRQLGSNIANHFRTGPQHDHTSKVPFGGHYMLVEAETLLSDERARLMSPVYAANQSSNACFRIFYYMYGASVGTLRVYVKPISIDMETLLQESRYLFFIISGNQRSLWHEGIFELDQFIEPFQLVIEGTAGSGHLSDIAIDDVALLHDNECTNERMITRKPPIEERDTIFDFQSCEARCNETQPSRLTNLRTADGGVVKVCDCHSDCDDMGSCCPNYRSLCVFGVTDTSESTIVRDETTVEVVITTRIIPYVTNMTRIATTTPTTMASIKTTRSITSTTVPAITTTTSTSKRATVTAPIAAKISTITRRSTTTSKPFWLVTAASTIPTTKISTTTRRLTTTNRSTGFRTTSKLPRPIRTASTTSSSYILTVMMQDDPLSPSHEDIEWHANANGASQPELSDPAPAPLLAIILVSLLFVSLLLVAAVVVIKYYRTHYGPENYKTNAEMTNRRKNAAATSDDFSDVRYLTSDEQIDFTLQTSETVNGQHM